MELLVEVGKQVPHLAVLASLVYVFIRSKRESESSFLGTLASLDKAWRDELKIRDEALTHLGDSCHAFQRDLAAKNEAVFEKVIRAMDKNTETMVRSANVIERLEARLDGVKAKKIPSGDAG